MKITVRKSGETFSVYVPKKDLEAIVVDYQQEGVFGGIFTLDNGWKLHIDPMEEYPQLPKTIEATKL